MSWLAKTGAAGFALALFACAAVKGRYHYDPSQVTIHALDVEPDGSTRIRCETMAETMWVCQEVEIDVRADRIELIFWRGKTTDQPGWVRSVELENPGSLPIVVVDPDGPDRQIWP